MIFFKYYMGYHSILSINMICALNLQKKGIFKVLTRELDRNLTIRTSAKLVLLKFRVRPGLALAELDYV